ncbi:T3JAM protein, partial [Corythaeola cristata]|nr:T3JAM protein [Corythaeola cristata]
MPTRPRQARPWHRRASESYEEKCERRHETREERRRRSNATTCRHHHHGRGAEEPPQSPRQREFLRRRNLASDGGRTLPGQEPEAHIPPDPSSRVDPGPPIPLQVTLAARARLRALPAPASAHQSIPSLGVTHPILTWSGQPTDKPLKPKTRLKPPKQRKPRAGGRSWAVPAGAGGPHQRGVPADPLSPSPQEALHRELLLKQKMVILQELFSTLLQASEKSWQGQLNEDKLKCKLRALENQLQACTQSYSKECVKKILIEMEDQKQTYEQKAKESLQKMLEDKLQTEQQLQNSQRSLAATREDLAFWKEHYTTLKAETTEMSTAHTELENNFHVLQSELQEAEAQNKQLRQALHRLWSEHAVLHQRASALQDDNDLKAERISAIEDKLQKEQDQKVTLEATIGRLHSDKPKAWTCFSSEACFLDQVSTTQTPPLTPAKEKQNPLLEHPEEEGEESLKDEIQKRTSQLTAKENECTELRSELEALSEEYRSCLSRLRQCRDELNLSQSKQAKRRCGHWIPVLVAVVAMAIAIFLASYRP